MFACNKENQSQPTVIAAEQLFNLLEKNQLKKMKKQISIKSVDVNVRKSIGTRQIYKNATPLHIAARKGSRVAADVLTRNGANLEAATASGLTPLMTAARENQVGVIAELLQKGAWVGTNDASGNCALHHACEWGSLLAAARLLEFGADVNATNALGQTPLHLAAIHGHRPVARLLFAHHASPAAKDSNGDTTLHYSIRAKDARMTKTLLKRGARANILNAATQTPLELANDECRAAIFKYGDKTHSVNGARRAWATVSARLSRTTRHFPSGAGPRDNSNTAAQRPWATVSSRLSRPSCVLSPTGESQIFSAPCSPAAAMAPVPLQEVVVLKESALPVNSSPYRIRLSNQDTGRVSPYRLAHSPLVTRSRWENRYSHRWASFGPNSDHHSAPISSSTVASCVVPEDEASMAAGNEWTKQHLARTVSNWSELGPVQLPEDDDDQENNVKSSAASERVSSDSDKSKQFDGTLSLAGAEYENVLTQLLRGTEPQKVMNVNLSESDVSFAEHFNYVHESLSEANQTSTCASNLSECSFSASDVTTVSSASTGSLESDDDDYFRSIVLSLYR